ncbi:uncharacterized protein LOC126720024 [Quercus robur]|uniref:uncharacterized protein LOC126720024 n=1 Tax=Quercus robur TaxID=38942 RepID=UPI00216147B2|nr:uncharacterized protein LOC126720024 [Quercus robur]
MYRFEPRLQCLSLVLLVVLVPHLLSEARPLNPSMEVEGRKKQSLSSSTVEALVKEQYVANKGETPGPRGPPFLYATPSHPGNHEMSAGQMIQGSEYVPLKKGPVPPSAPNPTTHGR